MTAPPDTMPALERVRLALSESIRVKRLLLHGAAEAIAEAGQVVAAALDGGGKVLLFGNGGSASDAQHIAAEWVGRYVSDRHAMPAIALTANSSEITSIGNDYGFEQVFARGIEAHGAAGDVAIALSTSGNSPNVLAAVAVARAKGVTTIGLTGASGGKLASEVDLAIKVPSAETPRIQECHIAICHAICEVVEDVVSRGAS